MCLVILADPLPAQLKLDSLFIELDQAITQEKKYTSLKESYLDKLKSQLQNQTSKDGIYYACLNLASEYETYLCDSSIAYSRRALETAIEVNNAGWIADSRIQLARSEAKAGIFTKALTFLDLVSKEGLTKNQLVNYYKTYADIYIYMVEYQGSYDVEELVAKKNRYLDILIGILDKKSYDYAVKQGLRYIENGKYADAEGLLLGYFPKVKPSTKESAGIASVLSFLYAQKGDREKEKKYLAISAISDVKAAVKENISLRTVAVLLFENGDIERANFYIKKSLDDANFYNARLRNIQTSKILPIIDRAYQLDREHQQNKLRQLLVMVSVLFVMLLIFISFIIIQMKKLAKAKQHIEEVNSRLSELNLLLQENNKQQKQTNVSLAEANHIKERFISNFLDICTQYIDKLETFKITVNRKIKSGQTADLLKLTSKTVDSNQELRELYQNFDQAFLKIYPTFIQQFNLLLRPDERYAVDPDRNLNQELRVFALIKLGIKDTNKIATFLHYTPRTVYNYRSKVKSKALESDEYFEERVKQVCSDSF